MLACLEVIGSDGVPHPAGPVFLLGLNGIGRIGNRSFCDRIGEDTLLFLRVVKTEGGLHIEVFEEVHAQVCITEHTPIGVAVVFVTFQTGHRILSVGIAAHRTGKLTFCRIDRQRRIELEHILQESAGSRYFAGAVHGKGFSNGYDVSVAHLDKFIVAVHTG